MTEPQTHCECRLIVPSENGLHMVPCSRLMKALKPFQSQVMIHYQDKSVDASSMIDLLTLAAPQGSELLFVASGPDAPAAIQVIQRLFAEGFDEE